MKLIPGGAVVREQQLQIVGFRGSRGGKNHTCATRDDSAKENDPPLSAERDGAEADVIV